LTEIIFLKPMPIFEVTYRPIISVADIIGHLLSLSSSNSHIGRSSKGQIFSDNIGGQCIGRSLFLTSFCFQVKSISVQFAKRDDDISYNKMRASKDGIRLQK